MSRFFWCQRRLYSLMLAGFMVGLPACGGKDAESDIAEGNDDNVKLNTDLVFNNITLEQSDADGGVRWRMIADKATYSQDRRDATIERPSGEIFQEGGKQNKPAFTIEAKRGEVRQNGERLLLVGNVIVTDEETGSVIRGNEMRWLPADNTIVLQGNVSANHPEFKMTAQKITVWVNEERIQAQGEVKAESTDSSLQFNGEEINWFLQEERIASDRLVRFQQREDGKVISRAQGNKIAYDLAKQIAILRDDAVVVAQDPPIRVSGDDLEWDRIKNTINASKRVTVFHSVEKVTLVGNKALGHLDDQIFDFNGDVIVTAARNQARLRSDKLTWVMPTQRVVAEGNVVYRQIDPVFNLTGPRAVGRLEDETIVVSGGRVVTEIIPGS